MPATIQQDITLCINATGCHFTGPLALRRSASLSLPLGSAGLPTAVSTSADYSDNTL